VLVVDDSPTVREQCASLLGGTYDCLTATNGEEGLEVARRERPDVILLDLEMPTMDGATLLRKLRDLAATSSIPVVVMTGAVGVHHLMRCRTLGCSGYVLKPVQGDYLLAKLARLVDD